MSAEKRWHGLRALVHDAIGHGSAAVEQVHKATASRPFDILEQIPAVATPTRVVRVIHDTTVSTVYSAIRLSNRTVSRVVDVALDAREATDRTEPDAAPQEQEQGEEGDALEDSPAPEPDSDAG